MRNIFSARLFCALSLSLGFFLSQNIAANYSWAQTKKPVFKPAIGQTPPMTNAAAPPTVAAAAPAPKKSPIRGSYGLEYDGNTFGKSLTQTPSGDPATFTHDFRLGYAVSKANVIGVREVVSQNLETPPGTTSNFTARDWRIYLTWGNMIETSHVEMNGTLDIVLPTSEGSQKAQKLVSFNIKNSWTLKTQMRNWSYNILTVVSPLFFQVPNARPDLALAAVPNITVDVGPRTHIYWELGLDALHMNSANFVDFTEGDPDYMLFGPQFDLNSHFTLTPALKFYTGNLSFKAATLNIGLTAAL